jgi:hypothetical protein
MKVKDLREILEKANPDADIVVGASDHCYRLCRISVTTAMCIGRDFWEDHGEPATPEGKEYGKRVPVVVFE